MMLLYLGSQGSCGGGAGREGSASMVERGVPWALGSWAETQSMHRMQTGRGAHLCSTSSREAA